MLLLVVAEVGLRVSGATFDEASLRLIATGVAETEAREKEGLFRLHPDLFWELRPGFFDDSSGGAANEHTFRGPVYPRGRSAGSIRIAILGDSCAYGVQLSYPQTYGARLARFLRIAHPDRRVEVINAGVPGYTLYQGSVALREKVLPFKPDIAVFHFASWNEGKPARGASDRERGQLARRGALWSAASHLAVFRMLVSAVTPEPSLPELEGRHDAWLDGAPLDGYRVAPDEFEVLLDEVLELCGEQGIQAIAVLPENNQSHLDQRSERFRVCRRALTDAYRERITRVAERWSVPTVDMRALYAGGNHAELFLSDDPVHLDANGNLLLAAGLFEAIEQEGRAWNPATPGEAIAERTDPLECTTIGVAPGEKLVLELEVGSERSGAEYLILPSLCAAPWSLDQPMPVLPDAFCDSLLTDRALGAELGLAGRLDEAGRATAEIVLPPAMRPGSWIGFCFVLDPPSDLFSPERRSETWFSNDVWVRLEAR